MVKIDLYDWDGTITKNKWGMDTSVHFLLFCIAKKPSILKIFPALLWALKEHKAGKVTITELKEVSYAYLPIIANDPNLEIDQLVAEFMEQYKTNVYEWVKLNPDNYSIVISASPEFLLEGITRELGFNGLIATSVDKITGKVSGHNCRKEVKIMMLADYIAKHMPDTPFTIESVYSDTITGNDANIGLLGANAYLITSKGKVQLVSLNESMAKHDCFPDIKSTPDQLEKLIRQRTK